MPSIPIEITTEQIFFITFFVLGIAIIGFIVYYWRLAKKEGEERYLFLRVTKEFEEQLEKLIESEIKILISELNKRVQNLTDEAANFYKKEMSDFSQGLEKEMLEINKFSEETREKMLKDSEMKIKEMEEDIKDEISNFSKNLAKIQDLLTQRVESEVENFSKNIAKEVDSIYRSSSAKINEEISKAEENIEKYKEGKLKELDQKIYQIIGEVAKKTIGKTIDISTHEELVMASLEKAKKEKIF